MYTYTLEKRNKQYLIYTNNSRVISNSILAIDIINISWAVIGSILNVALRQSSSIAILDCESDYGLISVLFAFMFTAMGYFQIIRFLMFQVFLVRHQLVLGWLERN